MGAKFVSHRTPSGARDAGGQVQSAPGLAGRDHQQALVLEALRRAAGAAGSYSELRAQPPRYWRELRASGRKEGGAGAGDALRAAFACRIPGWRVRLQTAEASQGPLRPVAILAVAGDRTRSRAR